MATYTFEITANADLLNDEIAFGASFAAAYDGLTAAGGSVIVHTAMDLSQAEQDELQALVDAHNPALPSVAQRVGAAKVFALVLVERWQKVIIMDGVVQAGQAHAVATALATATIHAGFGNLYALEEELGLVTPIATFLEEARLTEMRNEIRAYLGMPPL